MSPYQEKSDSSNTLPKDPFTSKSAYVRRVVCAACKCGDIILAGARHFDSVMHSQLDAMASELKPKPSGWEQGFIDQRGVFMTREEAMKVALQAGQKIDIERGCGGDKNRLYSEGLY